MNSVDMQQLLMSIDPMTLQSQLQQQAQQQVQQQAQQQAQQQTQQQKPDLMELMQNANPQLIEMLAANGNGDLSALLGQLTAGLTSSSTASSQKEDDRDSSVTPPPLSSQSQSATSSLAGLMLPTTSNSTATTTTNTTDSCQSSVIVNGVGGGSGSVDDDCDPDTTPPPAKKCKTSPSEESTLSDVQAAANSSLMQIFGGLFPQNISALPLMFQSPLHQQFAGLSDFDPSLSSMSTPKIGASGAVKRQYSSNGKNYCDLCNKEVCNKYFLRTHMLKMHGIVIDENKTVIANIDTTERERMGNLSFRCDTCMTEFKTRTQLRQHKQDVHGVMPLSTPRNTNTSSTPIQAGKLSVPSTPTTNNSSLDDKCNFCDKRVPSLMMGLHVQQEHLGGGGSGATDLQQVMALLSAQTARQEQQQQQEKDDPSLLKCQQCQYATRDARNLEMHQERHEQMSDAKQRRGSGDEDEDEALKLTTEAALKMMCQNHHQFDDVSATAAALNLSIHKSAGTIKKEDGNNGEEDCLKTTNHINERNSHTSGSISPSGDSIPEGFGKPIGNEKNFQTQSFIVRSNDETGCFLAEFIAQLPVRSIVNGPRQIVFELLPTNSVSNGI